jgi:carboxynorspermidine decarboxylase
MNWIAFVPLVRTPAFVIDERELTMRAKALEPFRELRQVKLLYSMKACSCVSVMRALRARIDGYSCSSLFEAKLARNVGGRSAILHFVSPVIRNEEIAELAHICDRITVNSENQLQSFCDKGGSSPEVGVRLNPGLNYVNDERYAPCRRNSKLGVPMQIFMDRLAKGAIDLRRVAGLHLHSNCDSNDFGQLLTTLQVVEAAVGSSMGRFRWINLGGGYAMTSTENVMRVACRLQEFSERHGIEVIIEPGAAFVRSSGFLVATVMDLILGDDYPIAVLDTTINHWPEVFEYQFEPDIVNHVDDGEHTYLLAGCSCLAGDLFGTYSFDAPLEVGSRVVFSNAGAYSIVKAHMFNGINLPNVYVLTEDGELVLKKRFTYDDFASRCGAESSAAV